MEVAIEVPIEIEVSEVPIGNGDVQYGVFLNGEEEGEYFSDLDSAEQNVMSRLWALDGWRRSRAKAVAEQIVEPHRRNLPPQPVDLALRLWPSVFRRFVALAGAHGYDIEDYDGLEDMVGSWMTTTLLNAHKVAEEEESDG